LDADDRLGVLKPLTQSGVFAAKLAEIGAGGFADLRLAATP
jgi:hypothetical protein